VGMLGQVQKQVKGLGLDDDRPPLPLQSAGRGIKFVPFKAN